MRTRKLMLLIAFQFLLTAAGADDVDSSPAPEPTSPELVRINAINEQAVENHPPTIDVLPGEQIAFRADVLQFGNACPNPQGCPERKSATEFLWSADDRENNECSARSPESCRDRTEFQVEGDEMIFHIPYAMGNSISIHLSHSGSGSTDTITLHNAHYLVSNDRNFHLPTSRVGFYDDGRFDTHLYPVIAPSGINQPYGGPYYTGLYTWNAYPYYNWAAWSSDTSGWSVGVGYGYGPAWGWGYPGWLGYGYYRPGYYGYYHPGWNTGYGYPGYAAAVAPRTSFAPSIAPRAAPSLATRPAGFEMRNVAPYGGARPRLQRSRWR